MGGRDAAGFLPGSRAANVLSAVSACVKSAVLCCQTIPIALQWVPVWGSKIKSSCPTVHYTLLTSRAHREALATSSGFN